MTSGGSGIDLTSLRLFIKSAPNDQMEVFPGRQGLLESLFLSILPLRKVWRKAFGSNCRKFVRPRDTVNTASNVKAAFNCRDTSCRQIRTERTRKTKQRNGLACPNSNSIQSLRMHWVTYLLTGSDSPELRSDFLVSFRRSLTRTESGSRRRNPEMFAPPCLNSSKSNSSKDFKYNTDIQILQLTE